MAYFELNRTATTGLLGRVVASQFAAYAAWREARATRKALAQLSDRELYDIGLQRSDLDQMSGTDLHRSHG